MKSKTIIATVVALTAMLTTACTQVQTQPAAKSNINTYSAVVTADESFKPKANDTFVWYKELFLADENATVQSPTASKRFIEDQIEKEISLKNYTVTEDVAQADYMVGAAVILDNSDVSQNISNFVEVFPSLGSSANHYNEGTILVVITKPGKIQQNKILWRGAIQAYVVDEELTQEQRQLRVQAFIKQLMNSLPVGK